MNILTPKKLAIYYGWPSKVNGSSSVYDAVNVFKEYDIVVFGNGVEDKNHPDHQKTKQIINHAAMQNTLCFGHILSTDSNGTNISKINSWVKMNVDGIFCDKFGYNNGVSRYTQNDLIDFIHNKSLSVFANATNPDDVFSSNINQTYNPLGLNTKLNCNDWYLAESYQIENDNYEDPVLWKQKADKMKNYKAQLGTKMACISTSQTSGFFQNKWDYSYFSVVLYQFDAAGYGENLYSKTSNNLPFRQRKEFFGTKIISNGIENPTNGIYQIKTNVGILIDTVNYTTSILL